MFKEPCHYPRVSISWTGTIHIPAKQIETRTHNVSVGGMYLQCLESLPPHKIHRMTIEPYCYESMDVTVQASWLDAETSSGGEESVQGVGVRFESKTKSIDRRSPKWFSKPWDLTSGRSRDPSNNRGSLKVFPWLGCFMKFGWRDRFDRVPIRLTRDRRR
jgi:hypothetical protein